MDGLSGEELPTRLPCKKEPLCPMTQGKHGSTSLNPSFWKKTPQSSLLDAAALPRPERQSGRAQFGMMASLCYRPSELKLVSLRRQTLRHTRVITVFVLPGGALSME